MKLIFGLGNPEERYRNTRHNIGFTTVDTLVSSQAANWKLSKKHKAMLAEINTANDKLIIAKPTTYYNLVGESYQSLTSYYDIEPSNVLVVHDDLGLDFGTIRTRLGGSGGGSKGILSLNAHGGDQTMRLRIGINNQLASKIDAADFVLSNFNKAEAKQLPKVLELVEQIIEQFIEGEIQTTTWRIDN